MSPWSWVVVLLPCSACDAFSRDYDIWVDTLSTGLVRVYNQDLLRSSPAPDFVLVEELRLGRVPGLGRTPDETTPNGSEDFGHIVGLAVDGPGRIYVADGARHAIRVFDSAGSLLRTVGRHGDGPGEFQELGGVAWHSSGVLLAIDTGTRQVTVFDSLGAVLSVAAHHEQADSLGAPWRIGTDAHGFLHERDPDSPTWAGSVLKHRIIDDFTLATVDTIALPERGPGFDSIPTNWQPLWAVDPDGSVWHGNTNRFRFFKVTDRSDTTLAVELRRPTPRLEGRERDSLGAAWGLPSSALPRYKAVLESFHVARDGRVWAWNPHVHQTSGRWEVFDRNGYHLGQVAAPVLLSPSPSPVFGHGTITGVTTDDSGVQYVVRLRIPEMD